MVEKLGIDENKIDTLCNLLYKNYGTTMAGLRVRFHNFIQLCNVDKKISCYLRLIGSFSLSRQLATTSIMMTTTG